ncbi:MAG TPA: phosphopantetheine-binding protein [Ktedonobacteraceae bacterium]|nr:phosphopantetheine-binding protein [Ktedonobacteraceae bacterium]
MESVINEYISQELIDRRESLPLKNDMPLLESGILDSLSVLKLVLFIEAQFGVAVDPEALIPENFETVHAICVFLRTRQQLQGV